MTQKIEKIFVLTTQDVTKALEGFEKEVRRVEKPTVEISDLKNEQIGQ